MRDRFYQYIVQSKGLVIDGHEFPIGASFWINFPLTLVRYLHPHSGKMVTRATGISEIVTWAHIGKLHRIIPKN